MEQVVEAENNSSPDVFKCKRRVEITARKKSFASAKNCRDLLVIKSTMTMPEGQNTVRPFTVGKG